MKADALFRSFSLAYYSSKIFGAMPFKVEKNVSEKSEKKSAWCRMGIIFSLIYIGYVITSFWLTEKVSKLTKFKGKKMLSIHDRTQTITAPMFLWSVVISQIFSIGSFFIIPLQLGQLNDIFVKLRRLTNSKEGSSYIMGDELRVNKMVRSVRLHTAKILIFYAILAISSAVSSFNRIRLSAGWLLLIMMDVVVKKMQALSLCVEFCALCDILLHGFSFVNENLQALKYRRREIKGSTNYPTLNEVLPPTAIAIKALSQCHSQLCDIIERVNQVYQIQNLLGIIVCTLKMLPHLFLTGIILTYSNFKILHISFFLWPAQYLYRVFIVCNSATKVTTEASKSYMYVGSLYDAEFMDDRSKREITYFMKRIENRNIWFSLCGLSKLDNACFVSTLVTVSGYFIIILQSYMTLIENWPTEISSEFDGSS